MYRLQIWPVWLFGVSAGILWGLPRAPYYHVDLPYIHYLGGCALVALYVGMGFLSLGSYLLVTEATSSHGSRRTRRHARVTGTVAVILAGGLFGLYYVLLEMSVSVS
jgi:hypothetical protein